MKNIEQLWRRATRAIFGSGLLVFAGALSLPTAAAQTTEPTQASTPLKKEDLDPRQYRIALALLVQAIREAPPGTNIMVGDSLHTANIIPQLLAEKEVIEVLLTRGKPILYLEYPPDDRYNEALYSPVMNAELQQKLKMAMACQLTIPSAKNLEEARGAINSGANLISAYRQEEIKVLFADIKNLEDMMKDIKRKKGGKELIKNVGSILPIVKMIRAEANKIIKDKFGSNFENDCIGSFEELTERNYYYATAMRNARYKIVSGLSPALRKTYLTYEALGVKAYEDNFYRMRVNDRWRALFIKHSFDLQKMFETQGPVFMVVIFGAAHMDRGNSLSLPNQIGNSYVINLVTDAKYLDELRAGKYSRSLRKSHTTIVIREGIRLSGKEIKKIPRPRIELTTPGVR